MYPPNKNSSSSSQHIRRISDGGSSSRYTLPPLNTSSSSRTNNTTVPTSLPPLHFNESYQQPQLQKQKSTYSYSYQPPAAESSFSNGGRNQIEPNRNIQHEEFYYPVYTKYEWSEDETTTIMPPPLTIVENTKLKKKREMDERIQEINREFLENREVLYEEKIKQLQDELLAVENGQHEIFDTSLADLEQKRRETIQDAKLMMIYQISTVDKECNMTFKKVQDESLAEQRDIQNALFTMIEEKRKKLKEEKDGEGDLFAAGTTGQQHQTRNRQRLLRKKRGELENLVGTPPTSNVSTPKKKSLDRQKENPSHLMGVLTNRVEEEIDADFYKMTRKRF